MKTKLVVTDLTRMYHGTVCIAGYGGDHQCIRPVLPHPGITENSLIIDERSIIHPFTLVEFDLLEHRPDPPHTEDYLYDRDSPRFIRLVRDKETVLKWSLFGSVSDIFDQPIQTGPGFYVLDGQGSRSLGTVKPKKVIRVKYEAGEEGAWSYRLQFVDSSDNLYSLKITDLTWGYFCSSLRSGDRDPVQIAVEMTSKLQLSKVYLRIGLARGWAKFPERCYLQVNGIYTFPDYLEGKTFADFRP